MSIPPPRKKAPKYENCDAQATPAAQPVTEKHPKSAKLALDEILGKAIRLRKLRDDAKKAEAEGKEVSSELVPLLSKYGEQTSPSTKTCDFPILKAELITQFKDVYNQERVLALLLAASKETGVDLVAQAQKKVLDKDALDAMFQQGILDSSKLESVVDRVQHSQQVRVTLK